MLQLYTTPNCSSCRKVKKYFEKYEELKSVDINCIDKIVNESQINVTTVFDKCTIVACKLPSGFVIVESSACIDPKNYDKNLGVEICDRFLYNFNKIHLRNILNLNNYI